MNVLTTTTYQQGGRVGINPHISNEEIDGSIFGYLLYHWNRLLSNPRTTSSFFSKFGFL
jgi:hypothetical protein